MKNTRQNGIERGREKETERSGEERSRKGRNKTDRKQDGPDAACVCVKERST